MGEENIFKMISDFYSELGQFSTVVFFRRTWKKLLKSAKFFIQLLGGPPLYVIDHGPPQMRSRHLPFEIDEKARQVWLNCFDKTLQNAEIKYHFPAQHLESFRIFLKEFSAWMVNKA